MFEQKEKKKMDKIKCNENLDKDEQEGTKVYLRPGVNKNYQKVLKNRESDEVV